MYVLGLNGGRYYTLLQLNEMFVHYDRLNLSYRDRRG